MFNDGMILPYFIIEHIEKSKLNFMYTNSAPFITKKTDICCNCIYSAVYVVYLAHIVGHYTDFFYVGRQHSARRHLNLPSVRVRAF
jgi:hypothetical protein